MSLNLMDLVATKIKLITIDTRGTNPHLREFFEQFCCDNKTRIECTEHFINSGLMCIFHQNLQNRDLNLVYGTIYFIADLARNEFCRDFLSNIYLICTLVDKLKRERDYYIRLQTCRALANMCFDHPKTQRLIIAQNPLREIFSLLDLSCTPFRKENSERFKEVLIALILNLLADSERIIHEVADKFIINMIRALEYDLKHRAPSAVSHNLFVAIVALTEVKPPEIIFSLRVCLSVVDMYRRTTVKDYTVPGLEFFEDAELPDITKYQLVEAGLFDVFLWALDHKPDGVCEEQQKKYELLGRVLANILAGDEAMTYVYDINNAEVINHFNDWLSNPDKDMIHTAALCLGNLARTDGNSRTVVEREVHKNLIRIAPRYIEDFRTLYALVSCLRNLTLARANKKILFDAGLAEVFLPMLDFEMSTSSPIIYKAISGLRHVTEVDRAINIKLGNDMTFVNRMALWSNCTFLPWIATECTRFFCSLVSVSEDREVLINLIEKQAFEFISKLLASLRELIQKEVLGCLTATAKIIAKELERNDLNHLSGEEKRRSTLLTHFHTVLIDCQLVDKLKQLVTQHGVNMEMPVLNYFLTFLEEAVRIDRVRNHLYYGGLKGVVYNTLRSRRDFSKIEARIEQIDESFKNI